MNTNRRRISRETTTYLTLTLGGLILVVLAITGVLPGWVIMPGIALLAVGGLHSIVSLHLDRTTTRTPDTDNPIPSTPAQTSMNTTTPTSPGAAVASDYLTLFAALFTPAEQAHIQEQITAGDAAGIRPHFGPLEPVLTPTEDAACAARLLISDTLRTGNPADKDRDQLLQLMGHLGYGENTPAMQDVFTQATRLDARAHTLKIKAHNLYYADAINPDYDPRPTDPDRIRAWDQEAARYTRAAEELRTLATTTSDDTDQDTLHTHVQDILTRYDIHPRHHTTPAA